MNAEVLYLECSKLIGSDYPDGMRAIPDPAPVAGCGFFPVASGSFHNGSLTEPINRKLLFVGQDWGCEENLKALANNKDADIQAGTGRILHELLAKAGIPPEECFFTNALFGIRKGRKNTGRASGWKDKAFRQRCKEALNIQIQAIRPQALVCLGRDAPHLIAEMVPACSPWKSMRTYKEIDRNKYALVHIDPPQAHGLSAAAILVHPSYRHINAKCRAFAGKSGNDAELVILKTLWEKVK